MTSVVSASTVFGPRLWPLSARRHSLADTLKERYYTQLFGAGKSEGMALPGRLHTHLPQKDIEKKNLTEQI
jgi:hypothetical protein